MNNSIPLALAIWLVLILTTGCNTESARKYEDTFKVETIHVSNSKDKVNGTVSDYFDSYEIIQLESTKNSRIGSVNRIVFFEDKIFILDKNTMSIFLFDKQGKFIRSISKIGKGPGEYVNISDFDLDKSSRTIILMANIPNKIFTYNFEGQLRNEYSIDSYYNNINWTEDNLYLSVIHPSQRQYVYQASFEGRVSKGFVNISELSEKFYDQRTRYPLTCESKSIYFYAPLEYDIIKIADKNVGVKYRIDFGANSIFNKNIERTSNGIYQSLKSMNAGFYISNFRETTNYITFKFEPNKMVFYSKKEKKSKTYDYLLNDLGGFSISSYFAHDSDDDSFVDLIEPQYLLGYKKFMEKNEVRLESEFLELIENSSMGDNPTIVRYYFKDN